MRKMILSVTSIIVFGIGSVAAPQSSIANTSVVASTPLSVTAGPDRTCAVYSDGALYCWGTNTKGNLGVGGTDSSTTLVPTRVKGIPAVSSVAIGTDSTCAITSGTLEVYCWGDNSTGALATPALTQSSTPIKVEGVSLARKIVISSTAGTCALVSPNANLNNTPGTLYCWGAGTFAPKDAGTTKDIAAGSSFFCKTANNGYYCFDSFNNPYLVRVGGGFSRNWSEKSWVVAGGNQACARNDTTYDPWNGFSCMGEFNSISWDSIVITNSPTYTRAENYLSYPGSLSLGSNFSCITSRSAEALCWGYNDRGQLGLGSTDSYSHNQLQFVPITGVSSISASGLGKSTCAIAGGKVHCWGANDKGQLGDGSLTDRSTPTLTSPTVELFSLTPEPTIGGAARIGSNLSADVGTWDEGTSFTYQWLRDGQAIAGANNPFYQINSADLNRRISYQLTARKTGYLTVSSPSPSSELVTKSFSRLVAPIVNGNPAVGNFLTTSLTPMHSAVSYSYQWLRDGIPIEGAVNRNYAVKLVDLNASVSFQVCGSKLWFDTTCLVSNSSVVTLGDFGRIPSVGLKWTSLKVGAVISGKAGSWDAGVALSYSWFRDGVAISNENQATYTVTEADRGHAISFRVVAQKPGYKNVTRTSVMKVIP